MPFSFFFFGGVNMIIVDKNMAPNLIINLLYLRDYTNYSVETYGKRLNKNQRAIDLLLIVLKDYKIAVKTSINMR